MGLEILGIAGRRKAQSEIMEYVLMVVFVVAAIIGIILFLTWWNVQQLGMKSSENSQDRVLAIGQHLMADSMFVNGDYVFDDAKLTALGASDVCASLQQMFGTGWYAQIRSLDMNGEKPCQWGNYPDCNSWTICTQKEKPPKVFAQNFPVNVYRKASDRMALAVLHVEVYS